MKFTTRLAAGLSVAVLAASAIGIAAPAPASAATYPSKITRDVGMYDCTGTQSRCTTKIRTARAGNKAKMICWEDGRSAAGSVRWFYVVLSSGKEGFVPANRVASQSTVKACWDKNASSRVDGVIAAEWALRHNGDKAPSSAENARLSKVWGTSANHMLGDWSGDCIGFAVLAWDKAGTRLPNGNAYDVYKHYMAKGKVKSSTTPPRGALVFWNAWSGGKNYGHVEISLGNGRSIGTQGWDGQRLPVSIASISSSNYLGWAMP